MTSRSGSGLFFGPELQLSMFATRVLFSLDRIDETEAVCKEDEATLIEVRNFFAKAARGKVFAEDLSVDIEASRFFGVVLNAQEYLVKNGKGDVFSEGLDLFFLRVIAGLIWLLERQGRQKLDRHDLKIIKESVVFFKGLKEMIDARRPRSVESVVFVDPY